jgi:hypothetical protein
LTAKCSFLHDLSLRNCLQITKDAFTAVGPSLKGVNLGGTKIDAQAALILADKCPQLERVNLHGIKLDDKAVDRLTKNCKQITTLHLSSANPYGGSSLLTDSAIFAIGRLNELRCLNLQGSSLISDAGVSQLALSCPKLERLNLGGCYRLTDQAVSRVASKLLQLSHLTLAQLPAITDASIWDIGTHLALLEELDLHGCGALTKNSVLSLLASQQRLTKLKLLDLGGCSDIPEDIVDLLRARWKELNVTFY